MATIYNTGLHRKIGIEFEYKASLQETLTEAISSPLVSSYNVGSNTPAARTAAVADFIACGPSMSFEAKKFAYLALSLAGAALVANASVSAGDGAELASILAYNLDVGMTGDGDFHFMVATFAIAEVVSRLIGEVVAAPQLEIGGIVTIELLSGGSGYTDGTDDAGLIDITFESTESTNPAGYTVGEGTAEILDGEVITIDSVDVAGVGFAVGQIVTVMAVGPATDGDTAALARVTSVS